MENIDHTESIHKGLNYIVSRQTASGEFPSYISRDEDCVDLHLDGTIFPSIVTGMTLKDIQRDFSVVDSTGLNQALNKLERFVLANQRYDSIWSFWNKTNLFFHLQPADIDDTVCASLFLQDKYPAIAENKSIFSSLGKRNGMYHTWLVPRLRNVLSSAGRAHNARFRLHPLKMIQFFKSTEASYHDADLVVQANVLLYLGDCESTASVKQVIEEYILAGNDQLVDKWYHRHLYFLMLIAKCAAHNIQFSAECINQIKNQLHNTWSPQKLIYGADILDSAFAMTALSYLKVSVQKEAITTLKDSQQEDGSWGNHILFYGGQQCRSKAMHVGWTSESMTTAFCVEALLRSQA